MSHDNPEIIRRHLKIYMGVFVALLVFTALTVGVTVLHMSFWTAVIVGLLIASVKASLVAGYFMHLIGEKKIIYWVIISAVVMLPLVLFLPLLEDLDKSAENIAPPATKLVREHEAHEGEHAGEAPAGGEAH